MQPLKPIVKHIYIVPPSSDYMPFILLSVMWLMTLHPWQLINPLKNLSVAQIRHLLDARGQQYAGVLEKQEIVGLLQQSGEGQGGE